jgi:hypothetical protein
MSRVVPAGTAMLLKTIVEQAVFDLIAVAASVKVQLGVGAAATIALAPSIKIGRRIEIIADTKKNAKGVTWGFWWCYDC